MSIAAIRTHAGKPAARSLMLYVALPAPHAPWLPSESFVGRSGAGMYGDSMMMVDHQIGRILMALDESLDGRAGDARSSACGTGAGAQIRPQSTGAVHV